MVGCKWFCVCVCACVCVCVCVRACVCVRKRERGRESHLARWDALLCNAHSSERSLEAPRRPGQRRCRSSSQEVFHTGLPRGAALPDWLQDRKGGMECYELWGQAAGHSINSTQPLWPIGPTVVWLHCDCLVFIVVVQWVEVEVGD